MCATGFDQRNADDWPRLKPASRVFETRNHLPPDVGQPNKRTVGEMAEISADDMKLLIDLHDRSETPCILGQRDRQGGERLVRAGYATAHALNLTDIEFRITQEGRRKVLAARRAKFFERD
jgi:hypothetical protein